MNLDNKYLDLFNEYAVRIKEEKLSEKKYSMSVKVSDMLFALAANVGGAKPIEEKDITMIGLVSISTEYEAELHRTAYNAAPDTGAVLHAYPVNAVTVGDAGVNIPAMLDDMAQIIGRNALYSEDNFTSIGKVLKKRNACMIKGHGTISRGRTLDEAYVACLVLEKSAKCLIDTAVVGRYKKISNFDAVLMHYIYRKKYSKSNQSNKLNELSGNSDTAKAAFTCPPEEMKLRQAVKDAGVRLLNSNLVQGTWGNISIRLDEKRILITPTALDYLSLKPEDMVILNIETMEYEGIHKPSGERGIHAAMMRIRKDINVVMHSHPSECSALAAANADLPVQSPEMQKYVGGDAKVSEYGLPSTGKLSDMTVKAMEGRNACIMANHGMLAVGASVEDTFETCRVMEESACAYIDSLAAKQSAAKTPAARRQDVFLKKAK